MVRPGGPITSRPVRHAGISSFGARRPIPRLVDLTALPVLVFLGVKLLTALVNVWWFPTLRAGSDAFPTQKSPAVTDSVALLIPMRDESRRLPLTVAALLDAGADEVIFLDDGSSDDSADLVRAAVAARTPGRLPPVRVVSGRPRPDGWAGKTWACSQLAELTDAEILVFCDCDVVLASGAVPAVAAELRRQRADVFSVFCRQRALSWGERLLVPLITDVVLCFLPFGLLAAPVPAAATASGALLAFRRNAYQELGGFGAVRGEVVEDVALARLTRRSGLRLGLALGGDAAAVRMYENYRQVVAGLGRGLVPAAGGRRSLVLIGLLAHLVAYTAPVLAYTAPRRPAGRRWWALAATMGVAERLIVEAKTGGRDWTAALLVCLSPLAAVPVVARAMSRHHVWKGRTY